MVGIPQFNMDLTTDDCTSSTISELITSLKSAFKNSYFSQVESVLISREEKLKREVESLKKENDLFEKKMEIEKLDKMMAVEESLELKEENSSLKKEKAEFIEKLKSIEDDKKTIIELQAKICDLECAKLRAENEAKTYKIYYEILEKRVYMLGQELKELQGSKTGGDNVAATNVKVENIACDVEIEKDAIPCDETADLKLSKDPSFCDLPDRNNTTGGGRLLTEDVIEIMDSDDDSSPSKILSAKEKASPGQQENIPSRELAREMGSGVLKRKWASSVDSSGDEVKTDNAQDAKESCPTGKDKILKAQNLFPVANSSPIDQFKAATMSFRAKISGGDFTPNKHASQKYEEKMGISDGLNSFSSSSSSSSSSFYSNDDVGDDVDSSLYFKFGPKVQQHAKRWEFEADMVSAFEMDGQLCMEAVCALYRLQTSVQKSVCGSSISQYRGFGKLAATRGTTLAEFLIDGDPDGKLKKSKEELIVFDHKGLDDCRRLAIEHSKQLFEIYQKQEDPLFLN